MVIRPGGKIDKQNICYRLEVGSCGVTLEFIGPT